VAPEESWNCAQGIPPWWPESNGKIERSLLIDDEELYGRFTLRTRGELHRLLHEWEHEHNHRWPHLALRGKTPVDCLRELRIRDPQPVRESA